MAVIIQKLFYPLRGRIERERDRETERDRERDRDGIIQKPVYCLWGRRE